PFFTTKDVGVGTGLGLSTVLGIIKSHGGFVTVSSKVGQGSKFTLFLPAIQAIPNVPTKEIEIPIGKGELILIVDDEAPICEIAKMILKGHNYNALTASNGIEAIALYAQNKHRISAVVMDMMMPEMDGVTAIRTLKKMNSQVRIIASSGINVAETLSQAAVVGVQQVLPKPFTAKELLNCLHHVLRVEN
ncbi:response regulator, partial [Nostoc sp. NIES-2111]